MYPVCFTCPHADTPMFCLPLLNSTESIDLATYRSPTMRFGQRAAGVAVAVFLVVSLRAQYTNKFERFDCVLRRYKMYASVIMFHPNFYQYHLPWLRVFLLILPITWPWAKTKRDSIDNAMADSRAMPKHWINAGGIWQCLRLLQFNTPT